MDGFRVREARLADRFAIAAMWRELITLHRELDARFVMASDSEQKYARQVQEMIRSRDGQALVAEELATGDLIGYVLGEIQMRPPKVIPGLYGFLSDLYVRDDWRQHSVGTVLFEEMKLWCVARKATAIELYVAENNPAALAFWQAMGMTPFLKLVHLDL